MTQMRRRQATIIWVLLLAPLVLLLLVAFPAVAAAQETVELQDLYGEDRAIPDLQVQINGSGFGYYGDSIRLNFDNQTGDTAIVRVPLGLQLVPANSFVQTMITAGNERIEVPPGASEALIKAFCGEASDGAPGSSDVFTPGGFVGNEVMNTIRNINRNEAYDESGQHAVWNGTDDYDVSDEPQAQALLGGGAASAAAAAAAGAAGAAAVGGAVAATNLLARPPGPVTSGTAPSGTMILGGTDALKHLTSGGATTVDIEGKTYVLPPDDLPANTNGVAFETVNVNGIDVIDPDKIALIPATAPATPVAPPAGPATPGPEPGVPPDATTTPGATDLPEGTTPPEGTAPPEVVKPPEEPQPAGPDMPDPGAPPDETPGEGTPPVRPAAPTGPPGTVSEPGADDAAPAPPPVDQKISDQEVTDIVDWGVRNNRTPEDIRADVNSRNESLGGSGEVPIPDLERVTLPQGEVTLTAEEARAYHELKTSVADMRSDAEYIKDHLKHLEAESRKWAALEQNWQGRAVAGIGDLYEDAQTYNAALDDSFADRFGRPGQFSWDTSQYDSYEEALKGWEQTEDYQRYVEARRSAVRDFVAKVNSKVAEDPTGETSWLNKPLQELKRIEEEQDKAIRLLRGVRAETERLAEMEARLAERIPGGGS